MTMTVKPADVGATTIKQKHSRQYCDARQPILLRIKFLSYLCNVKTSLIISTYNRPDALRVCLYSILRQRRLPDEVVIGDDGSRSDTADIIVDFASDAPFPVRHVWQEDKGFRLAMIRNKCVAAATGDYIIQTDGDIILHPRFIADHVLAAKAGKYLKGSRVRLNRELTELICRDARMPKIGVFNKNILSGRIKGVRCLPIAWYFRNYFKRDARWGLGCNMSFWRDDFLAVNGYDEKFEGWGREDDDLAHRLVRHGTRMGDLRFAGIIYHLWHPGDTNDNMHNNTGLCQENDAKATIRAAQGVDKYLL